MTAWINGRKQPFPRFVWCCLRQQGFQAMCAKSAEANGEKSSTAAIRVAVGPVMLIKLIGRI